jgi:hypothetical protein
VVLTCSRIALPLLTCVSFVSKVLRKYARGLRAWKIFNPWTLMSSLSRGRQIPKLDTILVPLAACVAVLARFASDTFTADRGAEEQDPGSDTLADLLLTDSDGTVIVEIA